MSTRLDLHDIQGNIVKPYGRFSYPKGRYMCLRVTDAGAARATLGEWMPEVTTAAPWRDGERRSPPPKATLNVAFSYHGLREIGVPRDSLQTFPDEFAMGMRDRRDILGDDGPSAPDRWDPVWRDNEIHVLLLLNAISVEALGAQYDRVVARLGVASGLERMRGHRGAGGREDLDYQEASAIYVDGQPTAREHFGYTDGISNPAFKGMLGHDANVMGGGKVTQFDPSTRRGWEPLETGEFLLGHRDEAQECPEAPTPALLARNGTYMVYRKLHQNVRAFDDYLERLGKDFPGGKEALAAKLAGRWRNGAPVSSFPTQTEADQFAARWALAKAAIARAADPPSREAAKREFAALNARFTAYDYRGDLDGGGCPVGAHVRRANPRGALEFGQSGAFESPGAVSNRRRLLRRGLPYGDSSRERTDDGDHGIVFMALNASIRRQFEFVQQQWMNYGNDFRLANDKDPIVGNQGTVEGAPAGRMTIQAGPSERRPFFCAGIPRFVETRGGDYFFVPSLTALRMIADGSIDPT
jgi:Dyp-type peroxidase family